jgi:cytidylate kinase
MAKRLLIAIDGPAASGKSTVARRIAAHYGLPRLDTGSLYRAVARDVLAAGHALEDANAGVQAARNLDPTTLSDPSIRVKGFGPAASIVAALPEVRQALLVFQREFAAQGEGAVVEGRDIGTVVCPDADAKLFVTATLESRARRRYLELLGYGEQTTEEHVLQEIRERDRRDTERPVAPLKQADDAHLLDTTAMDIDKALIVAVELIDKVARRG